MKFTLQTRSYAGNITAKATVITNDARHANDTLWCKGTVLVPFRAVPVYVNFGQINRTDGVQRRTITIRRGDDGPLAPELLPVTHPNFSASLREVEAGEMYELDVEARPPWPNRPVTANLTLRTGVSAAPEDTIRVAAQIQPRVRAYPPRFSIPRNLPGEIEKTVRLVWSGSAPGNVLEATVNDVRLSARLEEKNNHQTVVLRVPAGYDPPVNSKAVVTLKTDDPEVPTLPIQVYVAKPVPRLRAMPGWFGIPPDIEADTELRVRLVWSGRPGTILKAMTSDPATSVRVEEQHHRQYVLLHIPAGYALPVDSDVFVTLETDDERFPTLQIPLRAGGPRHVGRPAVPISPSGASRGGDSP